MNTSHKLLIRSVLYYSSDKLNIGRANVLKFISNFAIYNTVNFSLKRSKQAVFLSFLQKVQNVGWTVEDFF